MITCCGAAPGWTGPTALASVLAPALGRDPDQLAGQLPVGPPAHCAEVLSRYAAGGLAVADSGIPSVNWKSAQSR